MAVERPGDWATSQRDFHQQYLHDPAALHRQRVHYRVVDGGRIPRGGRLTPILVIGWTIARVVTRRGFNEEPLMALWLTSADDDEEAALIFEFDIGPPEPEADATLVGEFAANGALCVETASGAVVWPTYNPRRPTVRAPRR